ncbi:MAG: DNA polymerase I [Gemmatimonadetes bacterium]|nr:DNA polymerase I [Gemmatimonadota bacterium]
MPRPTLYLIDGYALAYRAYYAFIRQPLTNAKGQNISAVYGVTHGVLDLLEKHRPDHLAFVLDKGKTFRHEIFPEYKGTRAKMPDEMRAQLEQMREMVLAMGVPILEKEGYEADDLMGSLARQGESAGLDVFLVTSDKDFYQLVTPRTSVLTPPRSGEPGVVFDSVKVEERFGVPPEHVVDVLALAGDSADNVPGVPGVGMKTAIKLVRTYGDVASVLKHAPEIKGRLGEKLATHADLARLSLELVVIDRDAPVDLDLEAVRIGGRDEDRLRELVVGLESHSLMERIGLEVEGMELLFEIATDRPALEAVANEIRAAGSVTLDTETTDIDPTRAELVGISLSVDGARGIYIPVGHREGPSADPATIREVLGPVLADPAIGKCGQNIKYDLHLLERADLPIRGIDCDTMIASYLLDASSRQHGLDFLAMRHLGHRMIPISSLIGERRGGQMTMDEVAVGKAAEYAAEDAVVTHRLRDIFLPQLDEKELAPLFREVEIPLIPVLARMEAEGVAIAVERLKALSRELGERSIALEKQIHEAAGESFNVNSPKQLQHILFDKIGLKPTKKTKTGYSTDASVLAVLANEHEVPRLILENRELVKLRSTYVDALPRLVNPRTGRIHTSFHQTVAATGRLSSSDPNLQNIPIRTDEGRKIREAFVARGPGRVLLTADYSQIELRILAHLSGDEHLKQAFAGGEDVHRATAARIFGVEPDAVDGALRRRAKTVNFGIIYGMGAFGLSSRLDISIEDAAEFIDAYFRSFPRIREFVDETVSRTRKEGYVTTMLKRRRYLPELNDRNRQIREFAERAAVNTAIQGSAADLIKVSMIRIDRRLRDESLQSVMTLQVHDELVFDAAEEEMEPLVRIVRDEMVGAFEIDVPLEVDTGVGGNWLEAHG